MAVFLFVLGVVLLILRMKIIVSDRGLEFHAAFLEPMIFYKFDFEKHRDLARSILLKAAELKLNNRKDFERIRNAFVKEQKATIFDNLYFVKAYDDLVREGKIRKDSHFLGLFQKRTVRTMSGVAPVTVLTKPYPCPGKCVYCPTDVRMPKSYLPSQPAAQRAFRQQFNPYTQVFVRLRSLSLTGHEVSKVELRVIGGTWSSYPKFYQKWFLKRCLQAMNEFSIHLQREEFQTLRSMVQDRIIRSPYGEDHVNTLVLFPLRSRLSWEKVIYENETAEVRCIGIDIETRPDFIDENEIRRLRHLGITKVEMGVQTTDDRVQEMTRRGHGLASVWRATMLLKDAGFKVSYHMMPNLPGSTVELDKRMIGELFLDERYQPDYLKIYPCVVLPKAALVNDFRKGLYKPYDDKTLEEVLLSEMRDVPEWCRIDRVARDIPAIDIEAGSKISNIRQILEKRLQNEGEPCRDIRSREIQNAQMDERNIQLIIRKYFASGGFEIFLSYEDVVQDKIIALLRLRFPSKTYLRELSGAALIREIHVYGKQIAVGQHQEGEKQHVGWGTRLMNEAERLARENGYRKIAVISGIGTREYYRKRGYMLDGTYMLKNF